jgi:cytochrome b561
MKDTINTAALAAEPVRYDRVTIALHWLTALLVVSLFAMAETWGFLPRGTPLRRTLQSLHISFGLVLTAVIVLRLVWRAGNGRRLPAVEGSMNQLAAKAAHGALYLLLVAQVSLGFLYRWAQGERFTFFGLFPVPAPFVVEHEQRRFFGGLHYYVGWTIIVLAVLHALAALYHHYGLRDNVLRRMRW